MREHKMNVLALLKNDERFVFIFDEKSLETLHKQLRQYAADKSLNFTWYDAAVISQKAKQYLRQKPKKSARFTMTRHEPSS
jgi:hypothetical protein